MDGKRKVSREGTPPAHSFQQEIETKKSELSKELISVLTQIQGPSTLEDREITELQETAAHLQKEIAKCDGLITRILQVRQTPSPTSSIEPPSIIINEGYTYQTDLKDVHYLQEAKEQFMKDCGRINFKLETPSRTNNLPANTDEREIQENEKEIFYSQVLEAAEQAVGKEMAQYVIYWATQMSFGEVKQYIGTNLPDIPDSMVVYDSSQDVAITINTTLEGNVGIHGQCYLKAVSEINPSDVLSKITCDTMIAVRQDGRVTGNYAFMRADTKA